MDVAWGDDEHDADLSRHLDRSSSPENDFIDIEGMDRPLSSASTSSQNKPGPSLIPAVPEVKRSRGRPRKQPPAHPPDENGNFYIVNIFLFKVSPKLTMVSNIP